MKPFIIVDRATAELELAFYGYSRSNAYLASQENAFMTKPLFELWASEVFFPALEERRREFDYRGRVLILMYGLGSHYTDLFLQQCSERQVEVLFLVPTGKKPEQKSIG
jgi:hypothetical protein